MKNRLHMALSLLVALAFLAGCGKSETDIAAQQTAIERFLTQRQWTDYTFRSGVYKYTFHTGPGTESLSEGDSAYIRYSGHLFSNGFGLLYTTNIEADTVGLDPTFIDLSPRGVRLGNGSLIRGLDLGLQGSREGDSLYLFLTSDLVYGEKSMGTVAPGAAVAFKIALEKVAKAQQ